MINSFFALIAMLFLHCVADYSLPWILAQMKQKSWWEMQCREMAETKKAKYSKDYMIALGVHSFEWAFVVMLPCMHRLYILSANFSWRTVLLMIIYIGLIVANTGFHYSIDDAKANKGMFNLVQDQFLHGLQILGTWIFWAIVAGW